MEAFDPLPGDVSTRRYVRVRGPGGRTSIAVIYPAEATQAGSRFVRTTRLLEQARIRVPEIHAWSREDGFMWVEDVGARTAYEAVAEGWERLSFWRAAIPLIQRLAELPADLVAAINGALDAGVFRRELLQSWELVLEPRGLCGADDRLDEEFHQTLLELCDALDREARTPCHRDFMARNFVLSSDGELVLIDHQDLRLGPRHYDLASLLNDSLYSTTEEERTTLDLLPVAPSESEGYHRAAAQRCLKIVGTFQSFADRGFDRYLPLIPPSLRAALRHLQHLPETASLATALEPSWRRYLASEGDASDRIRKVP